ncbi:MAG: hypothetical protein J6B95_05350 [Oscillospiraceae bacterium]|nr:hypothetical protein [Oscillospiraceae bacterium]
MPNTNYEEMDPELRKEVARDKVKKSTALRLLIAALMIGLTIYLKLSGFAAVIMIAAAIYIVISMIPVWTIMNQNMKFRDEEPKKE